jgi:hypothetical protein
MTKTQMFQSIVAIWVLISGAYTVYGQADGLQLLDAIDVVRTIYGSDVAVESGYYYAEADCWHITVAGESICVSAATGELVDVAITSTSAQRLPIGSIPATSVAFFATLVFIVVQRLDSTFTLFRTRETTLSTNLSYPVDIERFTNRLGYVAGGFALISISLRWIQSIVQPDSETFDFIVALLNINLEQSVPTWYATLLLFGAALVAYIIASTTATSQHRYWYGLAALFTFLSIDEASSIHEQLTIPLRETLDATGVFYFAWVIVGGVLVVLVGLIYLRFVWQMQPAVRWLIFLAGFLFVGGSIGIESISAAVYEETGTTAVYSTIGTAEELFEMLGVIVFIRALLTFHAISKRKK